MNSSNADATYFKVYMSDIGLLSRRLGVSIGDYIYENDGKVIPVEVKAATNTQAKSYKQFSKKYEPKVGFKASLKNIAMNMVHETNTVNIPLYLLWNMDFYE